MNILRYRALRVIVQISYEIAIGKRGEASTNENSDEVHIEYKEEPDKL